MYLFNEKGKHIEAYEMVPQQALIRQYKKDEMEKIPENERVYFATTNSGTPLLQAGPFMMRDLNYMGELNPNWSRATHSFRVQNFLYERNDKTVKSYIKGAFDDKRIVEVIDEKNKASEYFVLSIGTYERQMYSRELWMENIVHVPESLYWLHLLGQGQFAAVKDADIDAQLGLFVVGKKPNYSLDRDTLEHMYQTGLVPGSIDEIMAKTRVTEDVLKRVRKVQGSR